MAAISVNRAASVVVTGLAGAVTFEVVKSAVRRIPWRAGAVRATELALRGTRNLEVHAEQTRLTVGDIVAEARERIGEQTPPPVSGDHGHDHEH